MEVKEIVKRFCNDESGLELTEYALMIALIAIAILFAINALSGAIASAFSSVANLISPGT